MATTVATPLDFWRLADLAEQRGIRILVEPISGEHFATSATDPTILYRVTGLSCTCRGFLHWQRCTHHSLLLAELGWLPDVDPDPTPTPTTPAPAVPPPLTCPACQGTGRERVQAATGGWIPVPCEACGGTGQGDEPQPAAAPWERAA